MTWKRVGYLNAGRSWESAEDKRLLAVVERMLKPRSHPWDKPVIDWIKLARRHGRSILAVQARVSLLRAASRLVHGITEKR
jgi:hypothetical protein